MKHHSTNQRKGQAITLNPISFEQYHEMHCRIDKNHCGVIYPYSITEAFQHGTVFANERSALFWHDCGFAFLFGACDETALTFVYDRFLRKGSITPRRFVLFSSSDAVRSFLQSRENIVCGRRYFFAYPIGQLPPVDPLPAHYRIDELRAEYLTALEGRITPAFSWRNAAEFLSSGKGFCILDGKRPAAWAFSAAVSSEEIDIGIETAASYQHKGLGTAAAEQMIQYTLRQHKRPVWACDASNTASQKLAEKLGFFRTHSCFTFRKESD